MAGSQADSADYSAGPLPPSSGSGRRELIIIGEPEAELRVSRTEAISRTGAELGALAEIASDPSWRRRAAREDTVGRTRGHS